MNHFEKSKRLYGEKVDLHKELMGELIFIIRRIRLLEENLEDIVNNPPGYCPYTRLPYVDFHQCYDINKAIKFWNDEKAIITKLGEEYEE